MEKPSLTIVPLTEDDLPELMDIERQIFPTPWSVNMMRQELKNPNSYFYALKNQENTLLGYGGFWKVVDEAHIISVGVRPEYQESGLGKKIVQYMLDVIGELSLHFIYLEVRAGNEKAMNLYKKLRFVPLYVRKNYYTDTGEDAIIMGLTLD